MQATTTLAVKSWDEKPTEEFDDGRKMTRATVTYTYSGDLQGEGHAEYLMVYHPDGTGTARAFERVTGTIDGHSGSYVLEHSSTFAPNGVSNCWAVVPGSGTHELAGFHSRGHAEMAGAGPYTLTFEYELE